MIGTHAYYSNKKILLKTMFIDKWLTIKLMSTDVYVLLLLPIVSDLCL